MLIIKHGSPALSRSPGVRPYQLGFALTGSSVAVGAKIYWVFLGNLEKPSKNPPQQVGWGGIPITKKNLEIFN
jgi:hypothetical protein